MRVADQANRSLRELAQLEDNLTSMDNQIAMLILLLNFADCLFTHLNFKFLPRRLQKYTAKCLNQAQFTYYMQTDLAQLFENYTVSEAQRRKSMLENFLIWLKNQDIGKCLERSLIGYEEHVDLESIGYFLRKKKFQINQTLFKAKTQGIEVVAQLLQLFINLVKKESQFTYLQLFFFHFTNTSMFFRGVNIEDCIEEDTVGLLSELLNQMDRHNYKRLLTDFYTKFKYLQLKQHCRENLYIILRKAQFVKCSMLYDMNQRQLNSYESYFSQMAIQPASLKARLLAQFLSQRISKDCPKEDLQLQIEGLQFQDETNETQEQENEDIIQQKLGKEQL